MPQTEEHLDIVHLLGVSRGVVALTKSDLVTAERLDAVREEVAILLAGTRLEHAPVVAVSSVTGLGLAALVAELERQVTGLDRPPPPGRFRLPVDRAFHMKGHGVVVTGTAVAGRVTQASEVVILPGGERARVRSVEVHGAAVVEAGWRQRVALNLSGVERTAITRGHVVADPAVTIVSERFDARIEVRPAARRGVASHARVRLHLATAETLAKVVLLEDVRVLAPKRSAYAQLVLDQPVVALRGDRFVLRAENAATTLGGGEVVLPGAERHGRRDRDLIARLEAVHRGSLGVAAGAVVALASELALSPAEVAERLNADDGAVRAALANQATLRPLAAGGEEEWTTTAKWEDLLARARTLVAEFHAAHPLLPGIEMEAVREQLAAAVSPKLFRAIVDGLVADGVVVRRDSVIAAPGHRVMLGGGEEDLAARVEDTIARAGQVPPDVAVLARDLHVPPRRLVEVLAVLEKRGRVVRVAPDLFYAADAVTAARTILESHVREHGEITAAVFRDLLAVSRKFSIALLDHFDRTGVTIRVGDARKLRR
jgi:selenocysteine-specific elongation factor